MPYVLRLKNGEGVTLGLNGVSEPKGKYFGGADMDDFWFVKTQKEAYPFKTLKEAEESARRYGCSTYREWVPEET